MKFSKILYKYHIIYEIASEHVVFYFSIYISSIFVYLFLIYIHHKRDFSTNKPLVSKCANLNLERKTYRVGMGKSFPPGNLCS